MSLWSKFRWSGSLRASPRSKSLVSVAQSLEILAAAAKIVIAREYGRDLDAPEPTRADREREVWAPEYPDNEREAVREEIERLRGLEGQPGQRSDQQGESMVVDVPIGGQRAGNSGVGLSMSMTTGSDSDLTRQEREFLAELGSESSE